MRSLQEISEKVSSINQTAKTYASHFGKLAQDAKQAAYTVHTILQGSSRNEAEEIASLFLDAEKSLLQAVSALLAISETAESWIHAETVGESVQFDSATNSYERSKQSEDESNVFLHQHSGLENQFLDLLPPNRHDAVDSAYANAPPKIIELINRYASQLKPMKESGYSLNTFGKRVKNGSYYSPHEQCVAMNEDMNHSEYVDVIKHELGHFIDHMLGAPSGTDSFITAVQNEASRFDSGSLDGSMNLHDMLDDLFSTGACYDRNVTDIISALLINDPVVAQRFEDECVTGYVANYTHENNYWNATDQYGRSYHKREKEIFANSFAIETDGYRTSVDFVERWFPSIVDVFNSFV